MDINSTCNGSVVPEMAESLHQVIKFLCSELSLTYRAMISQKLLWRFYTRSACTTNMGKDIKNEHQKWIIEELHWSTNAFLSWCKGENHDPS